MGRTLLVAVGLLAGSIWIGSMVCLVLVLRIAKRVLDPPTRVVLFRQIGRTYGIVGTVALVVAIAAGVALAGSPSNWAATTTAAVILSGGLVLLTVAGMAQARSMSSVRRRALASPGDEQAAEAVRRGAALAGVLRSLLGVGTLVIVVLVSHQLAK